MVSDGHDEDGQRRRENIVILAIALITLVVILLNRPEIDDPTDVAGADAGPAPLVAGR